MIIAIGSDLCNIERIQNSLNRFGEKFERRVFTAIEQAKGNSRPFTKAGTLAKRFAAKEAFSKAVGTGFKRGVFMKDIGVVNARSGAPTLALTGGAAARLPPSPLLAVPDRPRSCSVCSPGTTGTACAPAVASPFGSLSCSSAAAAPAAAAAVTTAA